MAAALADAFSAAKATFVSEIAFAMRAFNSALSAALASFLAAAFAAFSSAVRDPLLLWLIVLILIASV
jgi:hypothetical protein